MKINKIRELILNTDETIITATLSKANEVVMLMSLGNVNRFNLDEQKGKYLFSVKNIISYGDGGFDITAKTTIFTLDEIVVIVNDFKTHGFVHYPEKYEALHLWRKDYHADISTYPIALYKSADGIPHLIFAEAWNHIQIMNLDTRQILTASKSLIEENAEESHIEFYKKYTEGNKLPWPRPYDYFFGKLYLSPNQKKFLSAGWAWGSCDSYNVYEIEKFIGSNRISDLRIGTWEHENRATCWVDDEIIAVAYNSFMEGEENATADVPYEIHFYKIEGDNVVLKKKIQISDNNIIISKMHFNKTNNSFITFSEKDGLSIISMEGKILFKDEKLKSLQYNVDIGLFFELKDKAFSIFELTE